MNKKILFVDDQQEIIDRIIDLTEDSGFDVSVASNGTKAFEMIQKDSFDIVVSDIRMPNGDGLELLDNVKANINPMPVFYFMTAYTDLSEKELEERGCCGVFLKPIKIDDVIDHLKKS